MTFAVAGGGRVSSSFVARLPRLATELGPVAAQSYRLASRIANSLGAGTAVRRYEDLDDSALILICAPAKSVGPIVSALAGAIECSGKTLLVCEGGADSRQLHRLQSKGAAVGSVHVIPGFEGRRFVVEGDSAAVREAKRLVGQLGGRVEEVNPEKLSVYAAGLSFGSGLFTPLMEASLLCLQEAGMPKAGAMKVVEALFQSTLRAYAYAGKRSWSGPLADGDRAAMQKEIDALAASNPILARHYREAAVVARQLLGVKGVAKEPGRDL
jgi:predicted short-subunit dehydrogenase-like oxidoreductase (DUF2520 family)